MAQFISGGNLGFKGLLYGADRLGSGQVMAQQAERFGHALNDAGSRFMEGARNFYSFLDSTETVRALKAAGRSIRSLWQTNEVRYLPGVAEQQHAPLVMQRWVMAEPALRQAFHDQRIDGYSDTYKDFWSEDIGETHYDYRRVMNGIVVDDTEPDEETGEYGWSATTWFDELLPDDKDLLIEEQADVIATWDAIKARFHRGGEDPTSKFNGEIG